MNPRSLVLLLLCLLSAACAQLPPRPDLPDAFALAPATTGTLAEKVAAAEAAHPGKSGFRLVSNGVEAYAIRAQSSTIATRGLDIQTYIWHADLTGKLLAQHALDAADRGVKVRILVDDMDARAKNAGYAGLDSHPNIEVRLFNPFVSRSGTWGKTSELGTDFKRLNHRMHNKSWIVDNRIAMVGGRNLGDEYFGASEETNFLDLDLVMAGPVVIEVSRSFDRYWNAPSNYPIAVLEPSAALPETLQKLRPILQESLQAIKHSPYATVVHDDADVRRLLEWETTLQWSDQWAFVSDDPMKLDIKESSERSAVLHTLMPAVKQSRQSLQVISPYFVPGEAGTQLFVDAAKAGVDVRILTNSLAANDVAAVHGGYSRYRPTLLQGGVQLWELKPRGQASAAFSLKGSSGSSLHTKAMVLDDQHIFVGSYNLDPRSTSLNSEQGVMVTDAKLATELGRLFEEQLKGAHSWQVQEVDGHLQWSDGNQIQSRDPDASASRRFQAWLMKVLPLQSQL